jgi:poly(A) polymerase
MLKLLQTGHALASIAQLKALGMARGIYPLLDLVVERAEQPFVGAALKDTDRRVTEGKPVAPSFLLACVLWADVRDGWASRVQARQPSHPALQDAIEDVFNARIGDVSGRGKLAGDMREIWLMQPRFEKRMGSTPFGLVEQARFRAAFDFMRLRADVGEVDELLADWWQEFSTADDSQRQDLVDQLRAEQQKRPRVQRAPRPAAPATPPGTGTHAAQRSNPGEGHESAVDDRSGQTGAGNGPADREAEPSAAQSDGGAPARKRRRRRRSGANRVGGPGADAGPAFDGPGSAD